MEWIFPVSVRKNRDLEFTDEPKISILLFATFVLQFEYMQAKIVLITGATSGIGLETARILHAKGYSIIATGRRQERLDALVSEFNSERILTCCFDVRNRQELSKKIQSLPEQWQAIDVLINNAGNAHGMEPFQNGHWSDWEAMIDINIKGLVAVTESILPFMLARKSGHIINVSSIAGDQAYPNGSLYCASKSAVSMITECLRIDLNAEGIKISEIKPGMVETEFSLVRFKGDQERASNVYKGVTPLSGKDVAEVIAFMVEAPKHVNIAEILLLPLDQASTTVFNRKTR
jgi:3-hydroxy acid dehydrogenase / malonic semialdehyde reductase